MIYLWIALGAAWVVCLLLLAFWHFIAYTESSST